MKSDRNNRARRVIAGVLAGALALTASPLLGGVAGAADPLPPLANPIADGAVCDGAPSTNPFTDLGAESASTREVILCLVATELTAGTTRTTYTPAGEVTRRQMALFIKRLADLLNELETGELTDLPPYDNVPDYRDVVAERPEFREAIGQLSQAGIVGGFPDGTYRPDAPVSRRQMAAFINRLEDHLRGEPYSTTSDYFDDDEGDSGEANLNALASVGIFQGDGQGNVFPGANITRRQMANILLRDAQVYFAARAINSPFDGSFEQLVVTPTAPATLAPIAGTDATTPADDRDYTVEGLTAGQQYRITLVDPANVGSAGGDTVFAEDGSTGLAAAGTLTARIVKVNGSALAGGQMAQSVGAVTPVNGRITFTIDGDDPEELVPVVYTDQGGANTRLNIDDSGRPTEPFGVGGRIRYLSEAPAGTVNVTVERVTTERDAFVGTDDRTYFFDTNDTYRYQGGAITRDEFSGLLSPGDVVAVTYDPDDADSSIFDVTTDDVDAPSTPTTAVINADGGPTANDVRITYTRPATTSPGIVYTLQRSLATAGTDGRCGTTDDAPANPASPAFLTITTATQAPGDGLRTYVFSDPNVPDGCHLYRVVATSPVSGSSASAQADRGTAVPAPTDTSRPASTYAAISTSAGTAGDLDAGDVVKIVFSEPLAPPAANASIQVSDGVAGGFTSASITNGTTGTFSLNTAPEAVAGSLRPAGTVLTITLVNDPAESPSLIAGVQRPATITGSSGLADPAGNTWDVGGSTDTELE